MKLIISSMQMDEKLSLKIEGATKTCRCGCGQIPPIARASNRTKGYVRGEPMHFCIGHQGKKNIYNSFLEKFIPEPMKRLLVVDWGNQQSWVREFCNAR